MKKILTILSFCFITASVYAQPTWSDDIACIIYTHCSTCHNDVGIGPFNLMNYDDAFNNRYFMEPRIVDRIMPPWPPNQDYRAMAHANVLTDDEIAMFSAWVAAGAPEGNPANAPEVPIFETDEVIINPDVVLTTEEYTVADVNDDLYKCFVIQTNWPEDRFVSELEIFPDNRNIVHHVLVYTNTTDGPINNDNDDPAIGYECGGSIEGGDNILFGEWVPGSMPRKLPEGTGIRIPAGASLVLQVHYPEGSEGQTDFVTLNINFAEGENIREVLQDQTLDHQDDIVNGPLVIFPFETKTFHEMYVLPETRTFLAVSPHAHLICTEMWSYAVKPDGEVVNMVEIPNWDFDWQGFYDYTEPIILPAGTELHGYAKYVNDNDNPNVTGIPNLVTLGEETEDEMMLFFYSYLMYEPGDENIEMDGAGHLVHHDDCETPIAVGNEDMQFSEISFYPNPVKNNTFHVEWNESTSDYSFELTDISGKQLLLDDCSGDCEINIAQDIPNGVYFGTVIQDGVRLRTEKVVVMR